MTCSGDEKVGPHFWRFIEIVINPTTEQWKLKRMCVLYSITKEHGKKEDAYEFTQAVNNLEKNKKCNNEHMVF